MDHTLWIKVAGQDGLPTLCGACWAQVRFSEAKVSEIVAACAEAEKLRSQSAANRWLVATAKTPPTTEAVVWLDAQGKVLDHRLRLVNMTAPGRKSEVSLVHIDGPTFYLYNFVRPRSGQGIEKVVTVRVRASALARSLQQPTCELPGVRFMRQQAALT
jgi:hypothetical protein